MKTQLIFVYRAWSWLKFIKEKYYSFTYFFNSTQHWHFTFQQQIFDLCIPLEILPIPNRSQKLTKSVVVMSQISLCSLNGTNQKSWITEFGFNNFKKWFQTYCNPFSTNIPLIYHLKTWENRRFSGRHRSGTLVENGLMTYQVLLQQKWNELSRNEHHWSRPSSRQQT